MSRKTFQYVLLWGYERFRQWSRCIHIHVLHNPGPQICDWHPSYPKCDQISLSITLHPERPSLLVITFPMPLNMVSHCLMQQKKFCYRTIFSSAGRYRIWVRREPTPLRTYEHDSLASESSLNPISLAQRWIMFCGRAAPPFDSWNSNPGTRKVSGIGCLFPRKRTSSLGSSLAHAPQTATAGCAWRHEECLF